jgi:APA family basic amino acid/polyamine antiporter
MPTIQKLLTSGKSLGKAISKTSIFKTKSIENIIEGAKKNSLERSLGAFDLLLLGIGCTIGTGIFVLTGINAAKYAGPAIAISYFLAAIICIFAALAYTEFAAMVPVAGSAYTYSYVVMGELVAWMVAWCLILEYTVCASTIASGWSGYFVGILNAGGIHIPDYLTKAPAAGGAINLPATFISLCVGLSLTWGTKESILVNRILVGVKLCTVFAFILIAVPHVKIINYAEFIPFGWNGVVLGAATIFFAYIGFDSFAAAAEETKNPKRNLPIGIIGSLLICALLYVVVSLVLTGITNYSELNNPEPMAYALRQNGSRIGSALVGTGALVGMTSAMLVMMYGQSRLFFVLSRDGLIPAIFSKIPKKPETPYVSCLLVTLAASSVSGLVPIGTISRLTSLGTLVAFTVVALSVIILRIQKPHLRRPFKCPAVFVTAPIAVISCSYLLYTLFLEVGEIFLIWIALGLAIYFFHSRKRSPLYVK